MNLAHEYIVYLELNVMNCKYYLKLDLQLPVFGSSSALKIKLLLVIFLWNDGASLLLNIFFVQESTMNRRVREGDAERSPYYIA